MKTRYATLIFISLIGFFGCQPVFVVPDVTPPSPPQGISTRTGDKVVDLYWLASPEPDVAGYKIYTSLRADGHYTFLASTRQTRFTDAGIENGVTYYYAVSAYDADGNESAPSADIAYDTPRPEGYDVFLDNYRTTPGSAGYDFSTYSVGRYDDQYTDLFFENYDGALYLNVWDDSNIRDMGLTSSLYDISYAPVDGWSSTKDARAVAGHTYAIETWDNHFAKVRITGLSAGEVRFDWVYQLQEGNPGLKHAVTGRPPLSGGSGYASRRSASPNASF